MLPTSSRKKRKRCDDTVPLSGSIVDCFRKQRQEEVRNVNCPMCNCLVSLNNINEHLDGGCSKHDMSEGDFKTASAVDKNVNCKPKKIIIEVEDDDLDLTPTEENAISTDENNDPDLLERDNIASVTLEARSTALKNDLKSIDYLLLKDEDDEFLSEVLHECDNMDLSHNNTEQMSQNNQSDLNTKNNQSEWDTENNQSEIDTVPGIVETSTEPYYLHNFMLTVKTVMSQKDDKKLFNDSDNTVVKSFHGLSDQAKMLYVRLFQRKYKWFRTNKIKYPRISENLQPCFDELIESGFLQTETGLVDLVIILNLLTHTDVQDLAKSMHITSRKAQSKKKLADALMKHATKQRSLFSTNGDQIKEAIMKKAKLLLGSCVKLKDVPRNVFSRILLLFTLNLLQDDDDNYGTQLSSLFLINVGRIVYPTYDVTRHTAIFQDRDDVISYDLANQDSCHMDEAIENKNFQEANEIYEKVHVQFVVALEKITNEDPQMIRAVILPIHLRRFTCTWLYTRICSTGVDVLQRNKQYHEAVALLRELLRQNEFCVNRRGWWWERLALNLDQHLKKPKEALDAVREGLADDRVRTGHRLALEQRARKILEAKRNTNLKKVVKDLKFTELRQPRVVEISGKRLPNEPVFVLNEVRTDGSVDTEVRSFCGVEEMALRYYRQRGFNQGIHGEGSTFNTLYGLLMWDVIFSNSVPDVFRTPFQAAPLDIYCENFYENRTIIIEERLDEIRNASVEKLTEWIKSTWLEEEGKTCVSVKWDLFSGVEQIMELARCIGSEVIAGICERFAKDYRHTRSGLPDLVVWNSKTFKYKVVEVKGPNDRLSTKQQIWLDVLVSLGVDTEVLYVKAVGGRRL